MAKNEEGLARLRAWWFRRQGLSPRTSPKSVADGLRRIGWLPTAGSTGTYLSFRARMPGVSRDTIDRAAIDGVDIIEIPGAHARPPVLVPRDEMAVALRLYRASFAKHVAPAFASGRYSETALKAIAAQVCRALDEGPLATADIRKSVTHPEVGELLVGALYDLSLRGVIRRYPGDARLDSSKYMYELRHRDDWPNLEAEGDDASVAVKATRLFLQRHGPASVDEIAEWAVLTKGTVRKALTSLNSERIEIDGWTDDAWLLAEDVRAWNAAPADDDRVVLLPYRDPFVYHRRPQAVLARRGSERVLNASVQPVAIQNVSVLHNHVILAGGALVGLWEYDPEAKRIVTKLWGTDKQLRARVTEAAAETERFVRQQLGDAKISAVDPPAKRAKRLAFCRQR